MNLHCTYDPHQNVPFYGSEINPQLLCFYPALQLGWQRQRPTRTQVLRRDLLQRIRCKLFGTLAASERPGGLCLTTCKYNIHIIHIIYTCVYIYKYIYIYNIEIYVHMCRYINIHYLYIYRYMWSYVDINVFLFLLIIVVLFPCWFEKHSTCQCWVDLCACVLVTMGRCKLITSIRRWAKLFWGAQRRSVPKRKWNPNRVAIKPKLYERIAQPRGLRHSEELS